MEMNYRLLPPFVFVSKLNNNNNNNNGLDVM
jgi:hypothetical protein